MKNIKFLILILTLGFFSCKKEYPKIDEALLQKELEKYSFPLVKESTVLCEVIKDSDFTPKLSNPINLAISNDGETAYVLNSICNRYTFSNNFVKQKSEYLVLKLIFNDIKISIFVKMIKIKLKRNFIFLLII